MKYKIKGDTVVQVRDTEPKGRVNELNVVETLLNEYNSIFTEDFIGLKKPIDFVHKIDTKSADPIACRVRHSNPLDQKVIDERVSEYLEACIVEKSKYRLGEVMCC